MKKKLSLDKILLIYFLVLTVASLIYGKFFINGHEMGFTILNLYFIFPVSALITNILSSLHGRLLKYLFPILYAVLGVVIPMIVFEGSGYDSISLYFGLIPSALGFIIGTFIKMMKFRKYRKNIK